MNQTDYLQTVLGNADKAGVYHMPQIDPAPMIEAANGSGFAVFRIDLAHVADKDALLATIGKTMAFPDWFGHNFDALADCLNDLGWRPAEGYLVLLEHCDGIHGRAEEDFVQTLQIFESVVAEWREQGIPFWCFVDMQADGLNWLPDVE
jgi:RNAse (barnase) inhibitor barstar